AACLHLGHRFAETPPAEQGDAFTIKRYSGRASVRLAVGLGFDDVDSGSGDHDMVEVEVGAGYVMEDLGPLLAQALQELANGLFAVPAKRHAFEDGNFPVQLVQHDPDTGDEYSCR